MQDQYRIQKTSEYLDKQTITQESQPQPGPNPYEKNFHSEWAFISLVLGVFGLILPLFSTLAIVFGIGGLMQINRENMKGRWMAIFGIILGFLGIIIILVAIIMSVQFLETYLTQFELLSEFGA